MTENEGSNEQRAEHFQTSRDQKGRRVREFCLNRGITIRTFPRWGWSGLSGRANVIGFITMHAGEQGCGSRLHFVLLKYQPRKPGGP